MKKTEMKYKPHIFIIRFKSHKSTLSNCCTFSECLLLVPGLLSSGRVAKAHRLALICRPHLE